MLTKSFKIRNNIRINIRILRKSLTLEEKYIESIKIAELAFKFNLISNAKNIAIFLPFDGEINTYPLILKLWLNKSQVFLPVIHSFYEKKMLFVRFTPHSILHPNQYNILEPFFNNEDIISISNLDIVITPLVAFDKSGFRLGMGGGFYDSFLKNWNQKKILPIGFAYNFQLVNLIPKQYWDVPLPIIVTPSKIWFFKNFF